jgi:hypothetical protein
VTTVFIGGSRRVSRLSADVARRLDRIVERRLPVLIGDANGADRAVQAYLHGRRYDLVQVLCAGRACRNNLGGWPVRAIAANGARRGFAFYASKDRVMADEADCGLMVWDGQSVGTLMNVFRLARQGKPVVVYAVPEKAFTDLKSSADWHAFVARCPADLRARVEGEAADEARSATVGASRPDATAVRAAARSASPAVQDTLPLPG